MRSRIFTTFTLVAFLFAGCVEAVGDSLTFTFDTLPASGDISGTAGEAVGWGYAITNQSAVDWLAVTSLNSDPFTGGTADASIFDFPVLSPGQALNVPYQRNVAGLYQFTWDATALVGLTNSGSFILSADFYNGDPLGGGIFVQSARDQNTPYSVTAVPEPSSLTLVFIGLSSFALVKRRLSLRKNS